MPYLNDLEYHQVYSFEIHYRSTSTGGITMKDLMKYKNYYGSVHFDDEGLIFYGKVEFIRALVTYEATNAKGLINAFRESIDDYLEMCKSRDIEPEVPFKGSLNTRLGGELHRRVALAAEQQHSTINKFIVETLNQAIK